MTRLKSPRIILVVAVLVAMGIAVAAQQRSTASMTTAATNFLASLTTEQRQQATFAFDSAERLRWHFVPQFERNGLQVKAMTEPQRKLAHELLKRSQRALRHLHEDHATENILKAAENGSGPAAIPAIGSQSRHAGGQGHVGWRVGFHHVSLHFDVVNGTAISSTPSFAANPLK
jgi:hypothetical protein